MKAIEFNGDGEECDSDSNTIKGVFHLDGTDRMLDYTICGETLDSDPLTAGSFNYTEARAINCPSCVEIIKACRGVKVAT